MSEPVLKAQSAITTSFGKTLTLATPGASPGDLVLLYVEGVSWFSLNGGAPTPPNHFHLMYQTSGASGFKMLMWAKVPAGGWAKVVLNADVAQDISGGWWGEASVFSNVGWTQPGWIDIPGTAGDYAQTVRTAIGAFTSVSVIVRVEFDTLGVAQWVYGWATGDLGFGLDASNRPIFFVKNTLGNPIGNVAANADIPGLTTNHKLWLRADLDPATGNLTYYYSFAEVDVYDTVFTHWTALGTVVAGTNGGTTPRVTNSGTVFYGTRDAATTPFNGQVFAAYEFPTGTFPHAISFSDDLPAGTTLVGGDVIQYQPTGEDFASGAIEDWGMCTGSCYIPGDVYIPVRFVHGPDRLVYHVFRGGKFAAPHISDPIDGPANWTAQRDRAANALGLYLKYVSRTLVTDTSTTNVPVVADPGYAYTYHAIVIRGRTDVVLPQKYPQPPRLNLGCADSYSAFITESDYATVIDEVKWTTLNWSRVLDDISTAGGRFPDELGGVKCVAKHGGLLPWKYGLMIERNDQRVWSGPIVTVARSNDAITVTAADALARFRKRFAIRDAAADYVQTDAGVIFRDIITTHARVASDQWTLRVPEFNTDVPIDRVLKPREFKYAWDFLSELMGSAVDAFVANGVLFVWEHSTGWVYQADIKRTLTGSYNQNYDLVYGVFTEEAFATKPDWSIDGMSQGNFVVVPAADSGEYGFRTIAITEGIESQLDFGVLDMVATEPLEVPSDQPPTETAAALQARADTLAALRAYAPAAIEGGVLSATAPVNVDNLLPGSIWVCDVFDAGYGQLLVGGRLRRVTVDVTLAAGGGVIEKISPTLEPPGTEGGD